MHVYRCKRTYTLYVCIHTSEWYLQYMHITWSFYRSRFFKRALLWGSTTDPLSASPYPVADNRSLPHTSMAFHIRPFQILLSHCNTCCIVITSERSMIHNLVFSDYSEFVFQLFVTLVVKKTLHIQVPCRCKLTHALVSITQNRHNRPLWRAIIRDVCVLCNPSHHTCAK